ncbi:MAG: cyclin-domain-containing protein [Podila humilis]|nr:MAG: cyclin-domain-containing protein [Podila humilis]
MQQQAQQVQHLQQQQMAVVDPRSNIPQPGAIDVVTNPQTTTIQLAEFSSVMVYTLWHTRPNINGASSNAYNMVPHRISVPPSAGPAFKKFCLKVLSATQLSSSVILLALKYIQKLLKNNPSIHGQQGSEFRLFTVSLMLANKFLDDNTFTNKTWSEVTGINVKEINVMEMEFLNQVQFSLFVSEAEYLDWLHSLETWLKQQGQQG